MSKALPIFAYGSAPKDAGTFTLYRALRRGLLAEGFDMRCIGVGYEQSLGWDPQFADEGCVLLGSDLKDLRKQAECFAHWCSENEVRFVMPVNSPAMRAALPHLSSDIRLIPRCADSMEFGYQRALTCRERIASIVATTPRHVEDLSGRYQVPVEQISLIPHGISSQPFDSLPSSDHARNGRVPLRLAFLGRLEHRQKGILFLPGILRRLQDEGIAYRLSVAGKGQHEQELKTGLEEAGVATHVQFVGALTPEEVPPFLHGHDVLLFPSQHEGFGFVLIEALMAGCIPVASRLPGVTDFIVQDGVTGMLCGIGDEASFANAISVLTANPERAQAIRLAARAEARERFSNEKLTIAYASLLRRWAESAPPIFEPRPWSAFNPPSDLRPSPVRNWLRSVKRRIVSHPFAKAR